MSETTVTETCSCGATCLVIAKYASEAREVIEEWRKGHKHVESVTFAASDAVGFLAKTLDNIEGQDWIWEASEVRRLITDTLDMLDPDQFDRPVVAAAKAPRARP